MIHDNMIQFLSDSAAAYALDGIWFIKIDELVIRMHNKFVII